MTQLVTMNPPPDKTPRTKPLGQNPSDKTTQTTPPDKPPRQTPQTKPHGQPPPPPNGQYPPSAQTPPYKTLRTQTTTAKLPRINPRSPTKHPEDKT